MTYAKVLGVTAILLLLFSAAAIAADPVTIAVTLNGDAKPGLTVTAKATVTINDGSTLQSIRWTQTDGVQATLGNTTTDTLSVALADRSFYKEELLKIVEEPPIADANLPKNIPSAKGYESGLQNRFGVVALVPHAVSDAGAVALDVAVTTTSGTYHKAATVATTLPWSTAAGIRNVPILQPVLLHGKKQTTYNWTLTAPPGSTAVLSDVATRFPEFTPDVAGEYDVAVTDTAANKTVSLAIFAGTWKGIVVGADSAGRPVADPQCMTCHVVNTPHFDLFSPWKQTGHAEIFTQNVNTPNGHYSTSCLGCHTVGYNPTANNNGIDETASFADFLASGLLTHGDPANWSKILAQFPDTARMANIQCENCHGPQNSAAHMKKDGSRMTPSSDVCGTCHGEPPRHGRYQQWEMSLHSNYETAMSEGTNAGCAKCHSAQGFIAWADNSFSNAAITVTWTADEVHPQTCQTCHEPHNIGTTSSNADTNAKVRLMGSTPVLDAGFKATNVGTAATCMLCHNGRRGLRDDAHFTVGDAARAPHVGPQADILMGQNLYFAKVGTPGFHGQLQDSCVTCHMEKTPPPSALSLPGVGTNHTFFASSSICSSCHTEITAEAVQGAVETKLTSLKGAIETSLKNVIQTQLRLGNAIDVGGVKTLKSASEVAAVAFGDSHGSQGIAVTLSNGTTINTTAMTAIKVVRPAGAAVPLYSVADPAIAKAGWNLLMVENDKSKGVHNPAFVNSALDVSLFAVNLINASSTSGTVPNAALGGGLGNGAGAVSCTTSYVYWAEIAGHAPGRDGSQWRTDLVARNLSPSNATLKFYLHQSSGSNLEGSGTVAGGGQNAFEDIVATLGGTNNIGSLEICSDQPLLVTGRIFNAASSGTFGQNLEGRVADLGYSAGQTFSLIGLRQKVDAFRTNISVTNGGTSEAQVAIALFDATGRSLTNYNLTIPAGQVVQDTEPFVSRAGAPDVGWGFATITVLKGANVFALGSMIDAKTNDPTSIPPKQ